MKLRCQSNSIRLRLKRGEVAQLVQTGSVEEKIHFGEGTNEILTYRLETSASISGTHAVFQKGIVLVQVPIRVASDWALGDDVGIETIQATGTNPPLQVLIEKDFACLNGTEEQNVDTFANPLAGTKC